MYCKDATRRGDFEHTSFDLLGYTFRGRTVLAKGRRLFIGFNPAMSASATKAVGKKIRHRHLNRRSGRTYPISPGEINPQVRGWIGYYGAFYRSKLYVIARRIDQHLVRWVMRKFERLRGRTQTGPGVASGCSPTPTVPLCPLAPCRAHPQLACGSSVRGDPHAGFCESRGCEIPPGHSPE